MPQLKLIAFDATDLNVVSANLQDAVLKVRDMAFLPAQKRFAAVLNRFDWAGIERPGADPVRRQAALRFERVLKARHSGVDLANGDAVLSLLALSFEVSAPDDPAGAVTLYFSGGGAIRLEVECIEAELIDLGPAWRARAQPAHPEDDAGSP